MEPHKPIEGATYHDTTTNRVMQRRGSSWVDIGHISEIDPDWSPNHRQAAAELRAIAEDIANHDRLAAIVPYYDWAASIRAVAARLDGQEQPS